MNGRIRPMISWNLHEPILVVICLFGVPAQNVRTRGELARRIWADIFCTMDLPKTIPVDLPW
jgi:hypothetical protein